MSEGARRARAVQSAEGVATDYMAATETTMAASETAMAGEAAAMTSAETATVSAPPEAAGVTSAVLRPHGYR